MGFSCRVFATLALLLCPTASPAQGESLPICDPLAMSCVQRDSQKKQLCGTDNITYSSRCQMIKAQCHGHKVEAKHDGPCHDAALPSGPGLACFESRNYIMSISAKSQGGSGALLPPKCRRDGSYAPVQCHKDTGCWCVTSSGKQVPNTIVRSGRPRCPNQQGAFILVSHCCVAAVCHFNRILVPQQEAPANTEGGEEEGVESLLVTTDQISKSTRRRSSNRGNRHRRGCSANDKNLFNKNLIAIFASEFGRAEGARQRSGAAADIDVIKWKFEEMDRDKSFILEKPEYRELRRLIKKVVKPKRCAKIFARGCDIDHNELITRQEWIGCLTETGPNYRVAVAPAAPTSGGGARTPVAGAGAGGGAGTGRAFEDDYDDDDSPTGVLQGSLTRAHLPDLDEPSERNKDDSESNDCLSDRKAVLDEQKNGDAVLYVPECTLDGRYQKVQCYRSTGYCWCVHEDTGKPIPGTSVKDQHPECDALPVPNRPMKGCPEQRKSSFIRDLLVYFENQMKSANGSGSNGTPDMSKWHASKEEQIATWSFVMLDKNKNKVLEKREWKMFRALVMPVLSLRRCGKKLPRYCDVNHDRKISITEWLNCLNAKRRVNVENSTRPPVSTLSSKRKGPNPLESLLKSD